MTDSTLSQEVALVWKGAWEFIQDFQKAQPSLQIGEEQEYGAVRKKYRWSCSVPSSSGEIAASFLWGSTLFDRLNLPQNQQ